MYSDPLLIRQETTPLATSHADKLELGKHKILFWAQRLSRVAIFWVGSLAEVLMSGLKEFLDLDYRIWLQKTQLEVIYDIYANLVKK